MKGLIWAKEIKDQDAEKFSEALMEKHDRDIQKQLQTNLLRKRQNHLNNIHRLLKLYIPGSTVSYFLRVK